MFSPKWISNHTSQKTLNYKSSNHNPRNQEAARQDKLVGAKMQAVKVIFDLSEQCRDELLQLVSLYGWDCPLSFDYD